MLKPLLNQNLRCSAIGKLQVHILYLLRSNNVSERHDKPKHTPLMLTIPTAGYLPIVLTYGLKQLLLLF